MGGVNPFFENSDMVVSVKSQSAGRIDIGTQSDPAVTVLPVSHNFLPDRVFSDENAGRKVFDLLNSSIASSSFARSLPASPQVSSPTTCNIDCPENNSNRELVANLNKASGRVTIQQPARFQSFTAMSVVPVRISVSDTTNLYYVQTNFQTYYATDTTKAQQINYSFQANPELLGWQPIISTATYKLPNGTFTTSSDTIWVNIVTDVPLVSIGTNRLLYDIAVGDREPISLTAYHESFERPIPYLDSGLTVLVGNPAIIRYDALTGQFVGRSAGQTSATAVYQGQRVEILFNVTCTNILTTLSGSQTITAGQVATLTAELSGGDSYTMTLSDGRVFRDITESPFSFTVAPTATTNYSVVAVSNGCGTGTVSGSAVVTVQTSNTCPDPYESNNTIATATPLSSASLSTVPLCIGTGGDQDWFRWVYDGKTYYFQVRGYSSTTTGVYRLYLNVQNNNLTLATVSVNSSYTDTYLTLYDSNGSTVLATNDDFGGGVFSQITYNLSSTAVCPAATGLYEYFVTPTEASFSWRNPSGATSTSIQIRPQGNTFWSTNTLSAGSSFYYYYPLTPGRVYEWQIISRCANGTPGLSDIRSFTAQCTIPAVRYTQGVSPTGALVGWGATSGYQYGIRWKPIGATNWINSPVLTYANSNRYAITGLTPGTAYEWQINMVCSGNSTAYSPSQTFTTGCNAPSYIDSDYIAISDNAATIYFQEFIPGTVFQIEYRPQGSTAAPVSVTAASTRVLLIGLSPLTVYEYRVRMSCGSGQFSAFTNYSTFQTRATCATAMYTIRDGFWNLASTWSCNRVPLANEAVEIRHVVSLYDGYVGSARQVRYTAGGKILYGLGAKLQLGL